MGSSIIKCTYVATNIRQGQTSKDAIVFICKGQSGQNSNETDYTTSLPDGFRQSFDFLSSSLSNGLAIWKVSEKNRELPRCFKKIFFIIFLITSENEISF